MATLDATDFPVSSASSPMRMSFTTTVTSALTTITFTTSTTSTRTDFTAELYTLTTITFETAIVSESTSFTTFTIEYQQVPPSNAPSITAVTPLPSPSIATPTPPPNNGQLSPGTKAGIAIGVTALFLLALLGLWRFAIIWRRKRAPSAEAGDNLPLPLDPHEFMTSANTHEMSTKHNVPEMDVNEGHRGVLTFKAPMQVDTTPVGPEGDQVVMHELDEGGERRTEPPILIEVGHMFPSAEELEGVKQQTLGSAQLIVLEAKVDDEEEGRKLKILRDRIDRIREEKERLERLQHLKDLEEQTKQEILDAQRKQQPRT